MALELTGLPNFNLFQNFRTAASHIVYYAFEILALKNRDLTGLPLAEPSDILRSVIEH